ncbi:MAG: hypothetical protein ACJAVK_000626 [Akkermansiaceae bacterium]|jgi:hypothetical protein
MKHDERVALTLQVVYPPEARSEKQVEIVGLVRRGWITPISGEDEDGK